MLDLLTLALIQATQDDAAYDAGEEMGTFVGKVIFWPLLLLTFLILATFVWGIYKLTRKVRRRGHTG